MPSSRKPYRLDPHDGSLELSGIPRLLDLIPSWHGEARCAQEPDPEMVERAMFFEVALFRQSEPRFLSSPSTTYAMLLCSECPVRRDCLRSALNPPRWAVREDDLHTIGAQEREHRVFGVWGGTVELERHFLREHPVDEAVEILENTFDERLEGRLSAYWAARTRLRPTPTGRLQPRHANRRDRRIDELLAKRQVKTRHPEIGRGAPGPGRGHLGSAGHYARDHGVSLSTARRRLRAA